MVEKEIKVGLTVTGDPAPIQDTADAVDDLNEKATDLTTRGRNMAEAMDETAEATRGTQRAVAALSIAQLAGQVANLGGRMRALADDVRSVDPALAEAMEGWGNLASTAGNAASTIAMGFATGGPIGAAVGGLVAVINVAQSEMEDAAKEAQQEIAESQRKTDEIIAGMKQRQAEAFRESETAANRMAAQQVAAYDRVRAAIEATTQSQLRLMELQGRVEDARAGRARAAIEGSSMADADKVQALAQLEIAAIERKYAAEAEARQARAEGLQQQLQIQERQADQLRKAAARAQDELAQARSDAVKYQQMVEAGQANSFAAGDLRRKYGGDPAGAIEPLEAKSADATAKADAAIQSVVTLADGLKQMVEAANAELETMAALADEQKAAAYEDAQRKLNDVLAKEGQAVADAAAERAQADSAFAQAMQRASQSLNDGFQPADLDAFVADIRQKQGEMTASEQRTAQMLQTMMLEMKRRQDNQEAAIRQLSSQIR